MDIGKAEIPELVRNTSPAPAKVFLKVVSGKLPYGMVKILLVY